MTHAIVNSPETGAMTWCGGINCPRCDADRARRDQLTRALTAGPGQPQRTGIHDCPGCRCQPVVRLGGDALPSWGYQIIA